jgi:hypothetical protein
VVGPGEPSATYYWETEQEDFLVLSGEGLLIVEGQKRKLRQWDFVHCPPETRHVLVGAGTEPCVILAASSRQFQKDGPWGYYRRHGTPADCFPATCVDRDCGRVAGRRLGQCAGMSPSLSARILRVRVARVIREELQGCDQRRPDGVEATIACRTCVV